MMQKFSVKLTLHVDPEHPEATKVEVSFDTPDRIMAMQTLNEGMRAVLQEEAAQQAKQNAGAREEQERPKPTRKTILPIYPQL